MEGRRPTAPAAGLNEPEVRVVEPVPAKKCVSWNCRRRLLGWIWSCDTGQGRLMPADPTTRVTQPDTRVVDPVPVKKCVSWNCRRHLLGWLWSGDTVEEGRGPTAPAARVTGPEVRVVEPVPAKPRVSWNGRRLQGYAWSIKEQDQQDGRVTNDAPELRVVIKGPKGLNTHDRWAATQQQRCFGRIIALG